MFRNHWTLGTGLERHDSRAKVRDMGWTDRTFADAMAKAGASSPDADTMESWRKGEQWPQKGRKDAILKVFFGLPNTEPNDPQTGPLRAEMDAAWEDGEIVRRRSRSPAPPELPSSSTSPPSWQPDPPWFLRQDFARLNVEPQAPGGEPDRFALVVSLRLDSIYLKIESGPDLPRLAVTVRAKVVEILPQEENVQPVPSTVLGNPGNEYPNVSHGIAWRIANPKGQNDSPLSGAKLCDMRLLGEGPHGVTLTLRCRDIDLDVEIHDPPPDVTAKQFAIFRRVLQRMDCDDPDSEHIDLARGGLHRGKLL